MNKDEIIRLKNIEGFSRLRGVDEHGNCWIQFEIDPFADQLPGECYICGKVIERGWTNLDIGGMDVCDKHVEFEE